MDLTISCPGMSVPSHSPPSTPIVLVPPSSTIVARSYYDPDLQSMLVRLWDSATGASLQTLEVNAVISMLSFSKEGSYLATDRGLLSIQSFYTSAFILQPQPPYNIFVKGRWVVRDMENLLWLPSDYRPICSSIQRNILMLGHASGRVTFIEFRSS